MDQIVIAIWPLLEGPNNNRSVCYYYEKMILKVYRQIKSFKVPQITYWGRFLYANLSYRKIKKKVRMNLE